MATYITPFVTPVLGIITTYGADDALGTKFSFPNVPEHGTIMSVVEIDRDDLGLEHDLYISQVDFTEATDNEEFDITDADLTNCAGVVKLNTWFNFSLNQVCVVDNIALPYWAPGGELFCQLITRGADNTPSADSIQIRLGIVY